MKGILIIGGEYPSKEVANRAIANADIVVAADSGFDYAVENGIPVDYVVGDMDSTVHLDTIESMSNEKVMRMSSDKDETDTEIGLKVLKEKGVDEAVIIGGGGGRLDHLLGIVALFHRDIRPDQWYTDREFVISIDRKRIFKGLKGKTVSFFPVGNATCRMKSKGLKWPLDHLKWERGDVGISNIVKDEEMMVEPVTGRLICMYSHSTIKKTGGKK